MPSVSPKLELEERAVLKAVKSLCEEISRLSLAEYRQVPGNLRRAERATELLAELIQFAAPHLSSLPTKEAITTAKAACTILVNRKLLSAKKADELRGQALRRPRGRPEKIRHLAARAEGLKLKNPTLTWQALANRVRPEDYPVHAQPFRQRLRRDVVRLRALLRRIDTFLGKQPSAL